jgi:hypothetical protein
MEGSAMYLKSTGISLKKVFRKLVEEFFKTFIREMNTIPKHGHSYHQT